MSLKITKYISLVITTMIFGLMMFIMFSGCLKDITELERIIESFGIFAPLAFIFIQIVQVIIPIIPGGVSSSMGVVLFGQSNGFIYNYLGIMIGAIISFIIVRRYGEKFILNFIEEKTYNKYVTWLNQGKKFDIFFIIALFIPGLPDDLICMMSALTNMSLKKYILINSLFRPVSLLAYSWSINEVLSLIKSVL